MILSGSRTGMESPWAALSHSCSYCAQELEGPQIVRCAPGTCLVADFEVGSVPRESQC